jgi:hypothetical protein
VAVDGFFVLVWFGWGQADAPSWLVVPLAVGTGLAALLAVAGVVAAARSTGRLPAVSDPVVPRRHAGPALTGWDFAPWATACADTASQPNMTHDPSVFARQRRSHGLLRSVQRLDGCDRHQILRGTGEVPVERDQRAGVAQLGDPPPSLSVM